MLALGVIYLILIAVLFISLTTISECGWGKGPVVDSDALKGTFLKLAIITLITMALI